MDAIDCMVMNNDLALESDVNKRDDDRKGKSRRDQRSYESSNSRRSPPASMNRKRPPSPVSSSSSRSRNQQTSSSSSSQKHRRNSSPSPPFVAPQKHYRSSPSSPPSSRHHHQWTRPTTSAKRSYSPTDSSRDRRQPTHRSRTDLSSSDTPLLSSSTIEQTKSISKPEKNDLSLISEDESNAKPNIKNSTAIVQSSPISTNHNPSSVSNLNESLLETSMIPPECELSLFAKSMISNPNTSLATPSANNFMQTLDIINKYKTISGMKSSNSNPQLDNWLKEIPLIIQRQIDLQKTELDVREREIKLREREITEKEKTFNNKSTENTHQTEPIKIPIPVEKTPIKSENNIHHDIVNISPEESVVQTIPSNAENSNSTTVTRKTGGKSRFSPIDIEPVLSSSTDKPIPLELQSIDINDNQLSSKRPSISDNLPIDEPILHPYSTELKVTSSSTSRKVEIQTGNHDSNTAKSSTQDLRLTLSKNRPKYSSNNDNDQTIEISPNSDDKQSNHGYQSQRSITSTGIEPNTDDVRRHRQQPYSYNTQRSFNSGSSSKYGSKQKRGDNSDQHSRLFEPKNAKSSRSTYKMNH